MAGVNPMISCAAGVLALLECLRHLSAPDCHGATLLMQSMGGQAAAQQQQHGTAQRASPQPLGSGLLGALLGLLHERHIAALQVCGSLGKSVLQMHCWS